MLMRRIRETWILSVVLLAYSLATGDLFATGDNPPNILIILVDDMGYGDPACYNPDSKIKTPNIDRLAGDGMRFTDAHASGPLCHVSRYGLLTGRYPFRAKVGQWSKKAVIGKDETTIASLMKTKGYRTAMVGKWHLGFNENGYSNPLPGGPVDVGFDSYFGIRASTDIPPYFYIRDRQAIAPPTKTIEANYSQDGWTRIQGAFWRAGKIAPNLELKNVLPRFTNEAVKVIQSHAGKQKTAKQKQPLMLYLAYPAPHTPWLPSKEFAGKSKAGMYGDFATMVDSMIGRVLKTLDDSGMGENTIVIFSSDNGPVWYEKDVKKFGHDSSGGLRGIKADAWEGGHRMPFIVRWPNKVEARTTSNQLICFTDLLATFADVAGVKLKKMQGPDSISFLPTLLSEKYESPARSVLVMRSGNGTMTIRSQQWKLIEGNLGSGGFSRPGRVKPASTGPQGQLYDLKADVAETKNLWQQSPNVVKRLKNQMREIVSRQH